MQEINNAINQNVPHVSTNTILFIIIAIIALYVLIKVVSTIIKVVAIIAVCWFILMSVQSTNLANIPLVKQAYTSIEKVIPSKDIWTKASSYVKNVDKVNKAINDLK